jgi:hypothetical protein
LCIGELNIGGSKKDSTIGVLASSNSFVAGLVIVKPMTTLIGVVVLLGANVVMLKLKLFGSQNLNVKLIEDYGTHYCGDLGSKPS